MLATVLSLSLASCGGSDDEPDQPGKPSGKYEVVSRTVNVNGRYTIHFRTYANDFEETFCEISIFNGDKGLFFKVNSCYNCVLNTIRCAAYGKVKSLSAISDVNDLEWINYNESSLPRLEVEEKSGFVIEGTYGGQAYYVRVLIDSYNRNASGEVIGINLKWQQFNPAQ